MPFPDDTELPLLIPEIAPPVEDDEEDEEEEDNSCENCGNDPCECVTCAICERSDSSDVLDICSNCDRCRHHGCCECWTCPHCDDIRDEDDSPCSNCSNCSDCCSCDACAYCGDRTDEGTNCSTCRRCVDCGCRCHTCTACEDTVSASQFCVACSHCTSSNNGCCGCAESDIQDGRSRPAPRVSVNCSRCTKAIGYNGSCPLCKVCGECCMSPESECGVFDRYRNSGSTNRLEIEFKNRTFQFFSDASKKSLRRQKKVLILASERERLSKLADRAYRAASWFYCGRTLEYIESHYPAESYAQSRADFAIFVEKGFTTQSQFIDYMRSLPPADNQYTYLDSENRHISVELEIDSPKDRSKGRKLHEALEKWQDSVVTDGSVHSGWEINTNPSSGQMFIDHMKDVCGGLEALGITPSNECGMHVHINSSDMGFQEIRRLTYLYSRIERALFDVCHPRRLDASYSKKCGHYFTEKFEKRTPQQFKGDIHAMLYNFTPKTAKQKKAEREAYRQSAILEITGAIERCYMLKSYGHSRQYVVDDYGRTHWYVKTWDAIHKTVFVGSNTQFRAFILGPLVDDYLKENYSNTDDKARLEEQKSSKSPGISGMRYRALNLHSHFYRGSIEFRHHEGAADYNTVVGFGRLCAEIVHKAATMTDADLKALPVNSAKAMLAILPEDLQAFVIGEWTKNQAILANKNDYDVQNWLNKRKTIWGIV